jgi:hypothetical protein
MCSLVKADLVWNVFSCEGGFYAGTRGVRFIQSESGRRRGFTDTKRAFNVSWLEEAGARGGAPPRGSGAARIVRGEKLERDRERQRMSGSS